MNTFKNSAILLSVLLVTQASAMRPDMVIEEYRPIRDYGEARDILVQMKVTVLPKVLANSVLEQKEQDPNKKFIDVLRDVKQPQYSQIQGYISYIFRPGTPGHLDDLVKSTTGYIEFIGLKDKNSMPIQKALLEHALNKLRALNPEIVYTYALKDNKPAVQVLKDLHFEQKTSMEAFNLFILRVS